MSAAQREARHVLTHETIDLLLSDARVTLAELAILLGADAILRCALVICERARLQLLHLRRGELVGEAPSPWLCSRTRRSAMSASRSRRVARWSRFVAAWSRCPAVFSRRSPSGGGPVGPWTGVLLFMLTLRG